MLDLVRKLGETSLEELYTVKSEYSYGEARQKQGDLCLLSYAVDLIAIEFGRQLKECFHL